jgi:periplasmic protein TonB
VCTGLDSADLQSEGLEPAPSAFRRHGPVGVSVTAHLVLLAVIVFYPRQPIDLTPTWLGYGDSNHTYQLVYVPPSEGDETPPDAAKLRLPPRESKPQRHRQLPKSKPAPPPVIADAEAGDQNSKAGSPLGTMIDGPITGHEVHIAYSVVAPNPPIDRAALPHDVVGDVVIEVTIDSAGNVVATKIVQSIGHGIDEKIEATLRRWHYQPATLDGAPVASRTDVHFHFPS